MLTINETFTEDAATFTCHISNCYGSAKTAAQLSIEHPEQYEETLFPPHFTRSLSNCTANVGSSMCWNCYVEGNPLPTIQWFKGEQCLDVEPRYDISFNNGESILRLDNLSSDDAGQFTIVAKNKLGVDQCSAELNVLAPPSPPQPPINAHPETRKHSILFIYSIERRPIYNTFLRVGLITLATLEDTSKVIKTDYARDIKSLGCSELRFFDLALLFSHV